MFKRKKRMFWLIPVVTAMFAVVIGVCWKTNVFGKFIAQEPYVETNKVPLGKTSSLVTVTSEGGNQKGSMGSGATPMEGVPAAEGPKGSETNPFVLLEIVPELAQQQLVYLHTSDEKYPLDILKIGIEASKKTGACYVTQKDVANFDLHNSPGEWFCRYKYDVFDFGEDETTTSKPLAEIAKIYSLKITGADIKAAGYDVNKFEQVYNGGNGTMSDLQDAFPKLFSNDTSKEKNIIRDVAIDDNRNWKKEKKNVSTIEISLDEIAEADRQLSIKELSKKYPDLFQKDTEGKVVDSNMLEDVGAWNVQDSASIKHEVKINCFDIDKDAAEKMDMSQLAKQHPDDFKSISAKVLNDKENWKLTKNNEYLGTELEDGYFVNVGAGNGDFTVSLNQYNSFVSSEGDSTNKWWVYSKTRPTGEANFSIKEKLGKNEYDNSISNGNYFTEDQYKNGYLSVADFKDGKIKVNQCIKYQFDYEKQGNIRTYNMEGYLFSYYGLKSNDILKRMLFTFQNEDECEKFNFKVIAMTPAQINKAAEGDTPEKLDMIERADMFYFGSSYIMDDQNHSESTDNIQQIYELYHKYIDKKSDYTFSKDKVKNFYENDLEWSSCYKIMSRLSDNPNLPLMLTQGIGKMVDDGVDGKENTHMYVTEDPFSKHLHERGSLNNIAKLYMLTVQFDMLARKSSGNYLRTFADDILPELQTVEINPDALVNANENTAKTTGYYVRKKLVEEDRCPGTGLDLLSDDSWPKKSCYYLWNLWTFYPSSIKLADGNQMKEDKDAYIKQGYTESFFDSNADPFSGHVAGHHGGSDGIDGLNVGVIHGGGSIADTNFSTLLGSASGDTFANNNINVAYLIMNKQSKNVKPLTVRVEKRKKEYQKMSNELILLDCEKKADSGDETLYVKLTVSNENNEDGIIKSLQFVSDESDSQPIKLFPQQTKDENTKLSVENVKDVNGANKITGYRVPANGKLTFFVPYQRSDWKAGKNMIKLVTQGRRFVTRKNVKQSTLGGEVTHMVSIGERTLFDLE